MIYWKLFWDFLKVSCFTFGGAYGAIPLIRDMVMANGWITEERFAYMIAVSESTPGPFAINMATYVGSEMGGVLGAACATLGVVLPSFVIILIVAKCFDKFRSSKAVKGCMSGLKPAVIGMIGTAVLSIGKTVFVPAGLLVSIAIFGVMLVLAFKKVHPIIIIILSAAIGIGAGILGI